MNFRIIFVLIVGIISISLSAIFIRMCSDMTSLSIAVFRLVISSLILISIAFFRKVKLDKIQKKDLVLMILGGFFLAFHLLAWITSLKYTSVANSVALVTTNPIFVGVFSVFVLKNKLEREIVIGIVLSVLGSFLISRGYVGASIETPNHILGDLLAILGAVFASGYILIGSIVRERVETFEYILVIYTITSVILLIIGLIASVTFFKGHSLFLGFSLKSYIFVFLLAVVSQLLGHTSFNYSLKFLKPDFVAIVILGEPIGASIFAYFLFRERVSLIQLTGMALIFIAVIISSRKGKRIEEIVD
ncbi:conserved hypothetical protein [Thermotomaculum hydrothermale]|uniref:EamA domain-containing protein n=1 Tax=Thermotomaculum hydrothermale TaxID=981385 RepID=A0A7R6PPV6_9BACT|nr:DMT family transporter [Thermotomaculum hydrothermale]BBB33111.1 conserved hypothetical protein [Thermotomaculum hydrothermale]